MKLQLYIAQGIGFIGMALVFIAFQQNEKRKILWIQASAGAVFVIHFLLLGAWTGMGMNFLEIPRNMVFAKKENKNQVLWTVLFITAFIVLGVFTWESSMSLFPIIAMCLSTVAFSLKNPKHIRFCSLPVSALWLTYNIISLSIAGTLTENFCLLSILIAIIRFDVFRKNKEV